MMHKRERKFGCKQCDNNSKSNKMIPKRMEEQFRCQQCSSVFSRAYHLKTHKMMHSGKKLLKCNLCEYHSIHVNMLKRHTRTHSGDKPFQCKFLISNLVTKVTSEHTQEITLETKIFGAKSVITNQVIKVILCAMKTLIVVLNHSSVQNVTFRHTKKVI